MLQASLLVASLAVGASSVVAFPLSKRTSDTTIVQTSTYGYFGICAYTPQSSVVDSAHFWPLIFENKEKTIEGCLLECAKAPATNAICIIAGDGSLCYGVDTSLPLNGLPSDFRYLNGSREYECSGHPCAGNPSQECGGSDYQLLYGVSSHIVAPTTTSTKLTDNADWEYLACYTDSISSRTLINNVASDSWTIDRCLELAGEAGYAYGGLEFGGECWGANEISSSGSKQDGDSCSWPCADDPTQTCGGSDAIDVYKTTKTASTTTSAVPSTTSSAPSATPTKAVSSDWNYQGCYTDSIGARTLARGFSSSHWDVTTCLKLVKDAGLRFGGVIYGGECWGSDEILSTATKQDASQCTWTCNDNKLEQCGGASGLDVYESSNVASAASSASSASDVSSDDSTSASSTSSTSSTSTSSTSSSSAADTDATIFTDATRRSLTNGLSCSSSLVVRVCRAD